MSTWERAADGLRSLADRPASLLLALLAVNALFLPYRERYHDSILYGFQVLNRVDHGRFADDLFFRHGSQDEKALFSRVAAPLARAIGLQPCFVLLYLAFNALFFLGTQRLARVLIPDAVVSTLGLFALAVLMPPIGGLGTFHINENFLTPRLLAIALAVHGFERMLSGRPAVASLLLTASLAMHPLMGFGGLLVFLGWCLLRLVPRVRLLALIGVGLVLAASLNLTPSLGGRFLGLMDETWRGESCSILPCLFSSEWQLGDWFQIAYVCAVTLVARRFLPGDPRLRDFWTAVLWVSLLAVIGSVLASSSPYALAVQGQPFRCLWPIQLLHVPLAFLLAKSWWARGGSLGPGAAVLVLAYPGLGWPDLLDPLVLFILLLALTSSIAACLMIRGTTTVPRSPGWCWRCLAIGLCVAGLSRTMIFLRSLVVARDRLAVLDGDAYLQLFPLAIAPVLSFGFGLAIVTALGRLVGNGRAFRLALLSSCAVLQCWPTVVTLPIVGEGRIGSLRADSRFVGRFLGPRRSEHAVPPTVYWPTGRLDTLWFDLGVNAYFSDVQLSGNVFNRGTAIEGRRRADLVKPFELELARRFDLSPREVRRKERIFGSPLQSAPPGVDDLLRLCGDDHVDYVVARQAFPGWYAADNGRWFIYDCRSIRSRLARGRGATEG